MNAPAAPGTELPEAAALRLAELGTRAPSLHNTQPWWFRPHGDGLDILPDPGRTLPVSDPTGRATRVAIGAAGLNVRLGFSELGWEAQALPLRGEGALDPMLRVRPVRLRPATPTERALLAAIPRRHTNRRGYLDLPVPGEALAALVAAARMEAGWLRLLGPSESEDVTRLIAEADDRLESRPGYEQERVLWSRESGWDGVRPDPLAGANAPTERLRRRDFGSLTTSSRPDESDPCLAVIGTSGETSYDDLRAGQVLQRVLLTATDQGLATAMYSQPTEVPDVRDRLSRLCGAGVAQLVLRFGYGPAHAPAPRRPVEEVLLDGV